MATIQPEDNCPIVYEGTEKEFKGEGNIVRYYRNPNLNGQSKCRLCGDIMHYHGWIDEGEEGKDVCPSDWIIKDSNGKYFPVKKSWFQQLYKPYVEILSASEALFAFAGWLTSRMTAIILGVNYECPPIV